jgi:hypothetical protein
MAPGHLLPGGLMRQQRYGFWAAAAAHPAAAAAHPAAAFQTVASTRTHTNSEKDRMSTVKRVVSGDE